MASTTFTDYQTVVRAAWLNSVNYATYEVARPAEFGAKFDGTTDDTNAWNAAIKSLGTAGGVVVGVPSGASYIAGKILVPANVILDGRGCTLLGTSNGTGGNILIETGYWSSGNILSNIGTNNVVQRTQIINFQLYRCKRALNLRYMIDTCAVKNILLAETWEGIFASFCLYTPFENIMYRNTGATWAYTFDDNCNALTIKNVYAIGIIDTGFIFSNKTYGVSLQNCSTEFCTTGVKTQEVHGFKLDGHYFEACTTGLDLQSSVWRKIGVELSACTFNSTNVLVTGKTVNNFLWAASNERAFDCVPGTIDLQADTSISNTVQSLCTGLIQLSDLSLSSQNPTVSSVPSWITISDGIQVIGALNALTATSGIAAPTVAKSTVGGITPMAMVGFGGTKINAGDQAKPFQTVTFSGGTTFNVIIDTSISYADYGFIVFRCDINDNVGTYAVFGFIFGTTVQLATGSAAGKTVTASNVGGNLRLTVGSFSHPSGAAAVTSLVRHM